MQKNCRKRGIDQHFGITFDITSGRLRMGQAKDPLHRQRGYVWSPHHDPEKEQATLRVILGGLAAAVYGVLAWSDPTPAAIASFHALALCLIYGVATRLIISKMQRQSDLRLACTTVADQVLLTVVLGAGGALTLPMLWAVFLFLIGAAGRYGKRTLALSCGTALLGIVALSVLQPWWMVNQSAALGIGLSVLGASIYLAVLIGRLGSANRDLALKAGTDPLTGLSNRYMLEQTIGRAVMAISTGQEGATALLLIDLDGFKEVNDTYGHEVGDVVLQTFAALLARRVRTTDTVARLGGDEFVVLARHVTGNHAVQTVANGVHAVLAEMRSVQDRVMNVSASIGACLISPDLSPSYTDIAALMRAADRAMYRAKAQGKGQTVFADSADFET
ncbi:GGDEF domain-containing protein [Caballeronia sordidicola]|uniref:GGDEF domain-containing protein n=1 Tax=Caballeronia sordidicola TaxID=196367 RepID=UPI000A400C8D|nr:GGDEF domain-containing protein [Caballeronia sordidicola]